MASLAVSQSPIHFNLYVDPCCLVVHVNGQSYDVVELRSRLISW